MKILLIDNYDSFVYNLYQYFDEAGCEVTVQRNDQVILNEVDSYDALILSPGPGVPEDAGQLKEIITKFKTEADQYCIEKCTFSMYIYSSYLSCHICLLFCKILWLVKSKFSGYFP